MTKTKVGLILAGLYLGVFTLTVCLTLFDNREGCGTLFPGMVTLPWSLVLPSLHTGTPLAMVLAMLLRLPGALLNAWIIYYLFRRCDGPMERRRNR
jgi:hypothetical protein